MLLRGKTVVVVERGNIWEICICCLVFYESKTALSNLFFFSLLVGLGFELRGLVFIKQALYH
jgi:hypothetical protein